MKFEELDTVVLQVDIERHSLKKGEIGTVLLAFTNPYEAYEVEFSYDDGTQQAQLVLLPDQIEKYEG